MNAPILDRVIWTPFMPKAFKSRGTSATWGLKSAALILTLLSITEATRLQNLYATAFFRRHLLGETLYDPFLTTAYATANEPAITFVVTP